MPFSSFLPGLRRGFILATALLVLSQPPFVHARADAGAARLDARAGGFTSYLLPNGFKILLVPFPSAASVRVELLVKSGSKQEGYGETGMAHLLEHMLFKSAGKRRDIKSDLTALGATWNGTTSADRTNYFETVAADPDKVDEIIRLEADRFIRASFTREHLASEMTVVRNELERGDSDPGSLVMRALQRQSFFWHGYGRPTIGARSDIEEAPFSALQAFHRRHYRPDNAALIVSGNFDEARVLALASRLFAAARNPAAPRPTTWTREEPRPVNNRSDLFLPAGKTIAASAWKLPGLADRQAQAVDLALNAICDNDWGSLRKDLVLERRLAVGVSCGVQQQSDYGLLVASASAGKEADGEALARALREHVESAAAAGIRPEQLERARQSELTGFDRLFASHEMLASYLSRAEVAGDWRLLFWQHDVVKAISADEASAALRTWLVASNRSDVLLRHAEGVSAQELPRLPAVSTLVEGRTWPPLGKPGDPVPNSAAELARATVSVPLDGARAALIPRRTQGDLAWLVVANDYGNEAALAGRRAACNLAGELMGYGGAGLSRDQLSARLEALQAHWTLGLGGISLEAPRDKLAAALDVLVDAWSAPMLPVAEFDRLKAAAIARLEAAMKDPAQTAGNAANLRFDNYPPGHPLQPLPLARQLEEVRAVGHADAVACVADFSGRGQIRLSLVGDFGPADVEALWARIGKLPAARVPYQRIRDLPPPAAVDTTPIVVAMPEKPNASISGLSFLSISDDDPDFPALRLAVKILGGDADSRIWQRLREREGLAYGAGASLVGNSFEPRSRLVLQASAASDKAEAARQALQEELARALQEGFSAAEVARAKKAWAEERKTSLRSEKTFAGTLSQGLLTGRDYAWMADYDARIAGLETARVNAALRRYLEATPMVWSIGRGK